MSFFVDIRTNSKSVNAEHVPYVEPHIALSLILCTECGGIVSEFEYWTLIDINWFVVLQNKCLSRIILNKTQKDLAVNLLSGYKRIAVAKWTVQSSLRIEVACVWSDCTHFMLHPLPDYYLNSFNREREAVILLNEYKTIALAKWTVRSLHFVLHTHFMLHLSYWFIMQWGSHTHWIKPE